MAQNNDKHILVAYFSATGTTARAAEKLANVTGGELYAITPAESYTSADLDWHDRQSRSSVEMNDPKARPAIKGKKENIADYDVIFIGYPRYLSSLHAIMAPIVRPLHFLFYRFWLVNNLTISKNINRF